MNEKFFELKKEKQDRMINAALKVFAINGYSHASTDEIVKEAGISKGLLFHYFTNKIGLYSFIYDYSMRFVVLELTSSVDKNENDYFSIHSQIVKAESMLMKEYPYMIEYLVSTRYETVVEALNVLSDRKDSISELKEELFKHSNKEGLRKDIDADRLEEVIRFTKEAVLKKNIVKNPERPDLYYKEMKAYISMLNSMAY